MIQEANLIWRYEDSESGLVMPWYSLPTLQWLKTQDIKNWRVFEYGCGYSTIWWGANTDFLTAVDTSEAWARAMGCIPQKEKEGYLNSLNWNEEPYDCIIVDGDWREDCVKFCLPRIGSGGHLIIDNYGQEDFPPDAVERTEKLLYGWKKVIHKQPNHTTWQTAVFTKP